MSNKERVVGGGIRPVWVAIGGGFVQLSQLEVIYNEGGGDGYNKNEVDIIAHQLSGQRRLIDSTQNPNQDFGIAEGIHRHVLVLRNAGVTLDK